MTHRKISLIISKTLAALFPVLLVFTGILLPKLVDTLLELKSFVSTPEVLTEVSALLLAAFYLSLAIALGADILLFLLLRRVGRGEVFTELSVALVSVISYCLFAVGVLAFVVGFFLYSAFLAAFVCFFLGLCLRVVKNVLDEGRVIKSENDLTV